MSSGAAPWKIVGALSVLSLSLAALGCDGAERAEDGTASGRLCSARSVAQSTGTPSPTAFTATGLGAAYDRAVARMTRANHLMESRQAAVSLAKRAGAPACVIAGLRAEAATLERRYADAIAAMSRAIPRSREATRHDPR
jgi:hypothetical protein